MANGTHGTNGTTTVAILVVGLIVLALVAAVVALAIFAPANSLSITLTLLAAIAPTVAALLAWLQGKENAKKVLENTAVLQVTAAKVDAVGEVAGILATETKDLHTTVNSNMTEQIKVSKELASALATIEGYKAQEAKEAKIAGASDTQSTTTTTTTLDSPAMHQPDVMIGEYSSGGAPAGTLVSALPEKESNTAAIAHNTASIAELQRVAIVQAANEPVPVTIIQPHDTPVPIVDMQGKEDDEE